MSRPHSTKPLAGCLLKWACLAALLAGVPSPPAQGQEIAQAATEGNSPTEYVVRAKRIAEVLQNVSWTAFTPGPQTPLVFGIHGELADRKNFEKQLLGRYTEHVRFTTVTNTEEARACHVLYLPNAKAFERKSMLDAIRDKGILSIGEYRGQDSPACIIELVRAPSRNPRTRSTTLMIRFNEPPAGKGITILAPLLDLIRSQKESTH
jgi:hypothetical protein